MPIPTDPLAGPQANSGSSTFPLRILVADDASDHQLILKTYLREFPYHLKFVNNGKEAVEEFQSAPYDIVLMDMQMPEMDGLAATKAIRSVEQGLGCEAIPIVALTASSDCADINASLLAGCNTHCCKPLSRAALLQTIQQLCSAEMPVAEPQHAAPAIDPQDSIPIKTPEVLKELAPGYLASRRRELPDLRRLLEASDWDRLRVLGHNMKGTAHAYGFVGLTGIGAAIERAAKASDSDTMAEQLLKLSDYLSRVQIVTAQTAPRSLP